MKKNKFPVLLILAFFSIAVSAQQGNRKIISFDRDWLFFRGGAQGAESINFRDGGWRKLNLPHDWSIEDLPGKNTPFDSTAISQVSGGFTTGGTGWYRKHFVVPAEQKNKKSLLQFDGVYMNAEIWLNGIPLGQHPYGYTSFWYDISKNLKYGEENILSVKVRNEGENSRWYSGSGIYRHVWMITTDPVHVIPFGSFVTTSDLSADQARLKLKTQIINESGQPASLRVQQHIRDADGKEVASTQSNSSLAADSTGELNELIIVNHPQIWSVENPQLYTLVTEVWRDGILSDRTETKFGIRTTSFDAKNGFVLNGMPVKLKGGCVHHDNGPLGACAYDRAEERRVELLKASGFNAIRCAHNPPSPAFLDACDRLGLLVIDEAFDMWNEPKNPNDYHLYFRDWWQRDVQSMVQRDRNHPCVILWSIGNEIPERGQSLGVNTAHQLVSFIKQMDSSRSITSAVNGLGPDKDPYFAELDLAGYNYAFGGDHQTSSLHEKDHLRVPSRVIVGTESYPLEAFGAWMEVEDHPYVIGDFVWTAFDYIGEASIGWRGYWQYQNFYPWNLAWCGDLDITGKKRPQSFYRDALWKKDQLSIFVQPPSPSFPENPSRESWSKWHWLDAVTDWNWKGHDRQPLLVSAYSSCEEVELFLNGHSLGRKPTNRDTKFMASWEVPWQAGNLKAIGYTGGREVNVSTISTASEVSQIHLKADRDKIKADGQDLCYVDVELQDAQGNLHPKAENLLHFQLTGPATIAGVGNGNPVSLESYQLPQRKAWRGRCLVIIKSSGKPGIIKLTVSSGKMTRSVVVNGE
ncbi:MAG: glycoside hydrolase family 2 TIM barrel-domain containing protein [Flavisolibacter sp.]